MQKMNIDAGVKTTPAVKVGAHLIRASKMNMKMPPRTLPTHKSTPVDHSGRIGYVHSTAHSNTVGNNGSKKKPMSPNETARG